MSRNHFGRKGGLYFFSLGQTSPGWPRYFIDSCGYIVLDRSSLPLSWATAATEPAKPQNLLLLHRLECLALSYLNSSLHIPAEVTEGLD